MGIHHINSVCLNDDIPFVTLVTFRCSIPSQALKNFSLTQLEGTWYTVRGLNPDYDCFNCAISTYTPTPNSQNYTLSSRYDVVMLNGSVRSRLTVQQTEQKNPSDGGLLENTQSEMGLTMYEKWYVLGKNSSNLIYQMHLLNSIRIILTDFKNATPRLNLNIFYKNRIVIRIRIRMVYW